MKDEDRKRIDYMKEQAIKIEKEYEQDLSDDQIIPQVARQIASYSHLNLQSAVLIEIAADFKEMKQKVFGLYYGQSKHLRE